MASSHTRSSLYNNTPKKRSWFRSFFQTSKRPLSRRKVESMVLAEEKRRIKQERMAMRMAEDMTQPAEMTPKSQNPTAWVREMYRRANHCFSTHCYPGTRRTNTSVGSAQKIQDIEADVSNDYSRIQTRRDSVLDPRHVIQLVNIQGSKLAMLPAPEIEDEAPKSPAVSYDPTRIEWDIWSHHKQTSHGRFPSSAPLSPEKNSPRLPAPLRVTTGQGSLDACQVMSNQNPEPLEKYYTYYST